jgi:hypothetical protein
MDGNHTAPHRGAWNKGKIVGPKAPFKFQEILAIRIRLQMQGRLHDLAPFALGIDSKLRACDRVSMTESRRLVSIARCTGRTRCAEPSRR